MSDIVQRRILEVPYVTNPTKDSENAHIVRRSSSLR
jgi:hypothetical protein